MITAIIGSVIFVVAAIFYIMLALGLPYGDLAMGGKYKVMPKHMRVACAVSVFVQLAAVVFILQAGNIISIGALEGFAQGVCYFFAFYLFLNTIMNGMSRSKKEKLIMTPLSFLTAICFLITAINA